MQLSNFLFFSQFGHSVFLFQSCAEGEEEEEEEGKEKTFEVLLISLGLLFCFFTFKISFEHVHSAMIPYRKRKWRSKRCFISRPDFTTEGLQRWFSR